MGLPLACPWRGRGWGQKWSGVTSGMSVEGRGWGQKWSGVTSGVSVEREGSEMEWGYLWHVRGGGGVRNGVGLPLACPWRGRGRDQKWSGVTSGVSVEREGRDQKWSGVTSGVSVERDGVRSEME